MNTLKTHKTFFLLALLLAASLVASKILVSKYAEGPRQTLPKQAETAQIESQVDQTQPTPASTPTPQPTPEPQAGTYINTKHGFKFDYPKELGELGNWSSDEDYFSFLFKDGWFSINRYDSNSKYAEVDRDNVEWIDIMIQAKPGDIKTRSTYTTYEKLSNIINQYPITTYHLRSAIPASEYSYGYKMVWKRGEIYYTLSVSSGSDEVDHLNKLQIVFDKIVDSFEFIEILSEQDLN